MVLVDTNVSTAVILYLEGKLIGSQAEIYRASSRQKPEEGGGGTLNCVPLFNLLRRCAQNASKVSSIGFNYRQLSKVLLVGAS